MTLTNLLSQVHSRFKLHCRTGELMHVAGVRITGAVGALPLLIAVAATGCGRTSTDTSVAGPSGTRCEISLTNSTPEIPAAGGSGTITVSSSRECSWSVSTEAAWIHPGTTQGQGPATVNYSVLPNPSGTPRNGRLVIAPEAVEIRQAATPCRYEVSPATVNVAAAGGQVSIALAAPDGCRWAVRSDMPWIGNLAPVEGVGSATVSLTVAANTAGARAGRVTIGDATVHVNQSGAAGPPPPPPPNPDPPSPVPACTYSVSPVRVLVPAAGEQVAIEVSAQTECEWTARSSAPWIIAPGDRRSGSGSVRVTVGANTGSARTGTISIADRTVTIEQGAAAVEPTCTYRLAETTRSVGREPEEFAVGVTAPPGCGWTVSSDASWITVAGGRSGTGAGTFRLAVGGNTGGGARTGTVRVETETLRIHQAAGTCTYGIRPPYYHAGRGPDEIPINVTAEDGCAWTAATTATWVTIEGRSGSGTGTVRLLIPANTDPPRAAVVTIAGHTFTLRQDGVCTTSIKPPYYNAGRGPDDIRIAVTADPGCTWTAASTVSWVKVAEGATGSGSGVVRLLVEPNNGATRSVTLMIAGQPFALRQLGPQ